MMAHYSDIEWTGSTWNPLTGCRKISAGCLNCYAERMAKRLHAMGNRSYRNGFLPTVHEQLFDLPLKWKASRRIFVNSMSDLFLEDFSDEIIQRLFGVMRRAHWHTFQILTKRSVRLLELNSKLIWPPNVWMGVTVESADYTSRVDDLRRTGAGTKFLSLEPLLSALPDLDLTGIDWVIVGGESGPNARSMAPEWATTIRDQCRNQKVPFFFKQWGGTNKKKAGRHLEGKLWDEMPLSRQMERPARLL
jgi:protein gp37